MLSPKTAASSRALRWLTPPASSTSHRVVRRVQDTKCIIWECDGRIRKRCSCSDVIYSVNVTPDGNYVAGCANGQIYLFSPTGMLLKLLRFHNMAVLSLKVFGDGKLVSASKDCKVCIWSPGDNPEIMNLLEHHEDVPLCVAICSNGSMATCDLSGVMYFWESPATDTKPAFKTDGHDKKIACAAVRGGTQVITASLDMTLKAWDSPEC